MTSILRFDRFVLDPAERSLACDGVRIELSARYFDALVLLVGEAGKLVSKDRFLADVWRGIPVTDEALTQCIKTLRQQLGDQASRPRFIETVPKHGYRFVATVEKAEDARIETVVHAPAPTVAGGGSSAWRRVFAMGGAGTLGAGLAGVLGGLVYGAAATAQPLEQSSGGASILLVVLWLTIAAALIGGAGVSFGIAAAALARRRFWLIIGGAAGGMAIGGIVKVLGLDAFNLLLGRSPYGITGATEGLGLGSAVGLGAWLAWRADEDRPLERSVLIAGSTGACGGLVIVVSGGRLMGGSLDLLAQTFPESRLRIDQLGALMGEHGIGLVTQLVMGALEGFLFAGSIVGAMMLVRPRFR